MPYGHQLLTLIKQSDTMDRVCKDRLQSGDWMLIQTRNSRYSIHIGGDGWCEISGGWFDRKGKSHARVRINGCTWGGSAINLQVAAACGLCIEFSNRVVTSPIQRIIFFPGFTMN
ncbi:MAG: hypothetical protein ACHQQQ_04610 [Bacteroidota bacterium]